MFSHGFAFEIAQSLIAQLRDDCERIEIAGSLRRNRIAVNDIDLIAIPRMRWEKDESLFGEPIQENALDAKLSHMCIAHELNLLINGPKYKRFHKIIDEDRIPIDIYLATEDTWWTLLLIRTGSQLHNIKLARRAIEFHMQLKADGSGLIRPGGTLIPIGSEQEIFHQLRLPYRRPEERE